MILSYGNTILDYSNVILDYQSASIITDSLFMELDASSYSGSGLWLDETANGNNATINGATYSTTDGGLFDFDGLNDTISIPHNSSFSLNTTTPRTIQVWVKYDVLPTSTNRMITFAKLSSAYAFDGYWGGISGDSKVVVATNGGSISKTSDSGASLISLNTWYLYTFISRITNTANSTKVYINTTQYINSFHGTDSYSESNALTLGYFPAPTAGLGLSVYLNGKIGACYFYTKELSIDEITTNYNNTKSRYGL